MSAYYNENDSYCVEWLRNLIKRGLIADGEVDPRDIREVEARDVEGFTQAHFFAGIGGWSYAARLARWPDDRPLWTGSFPCQDISAASAGRAKGLDGERSGLWFELFRLIREGHPACVGIENSPRLRTLGADRIFKDLEEASYSWWTGVVGADDVEAPHIRKRVWILAYADSAGLREQSRRGSRANWQGSPFDKDDIDSDQDGKSRFAVDEQVGGKLEVSCDPDRQSLAVGESVGGYARTQLAALERAVGEGGYRWNGGPDRYFCVAYGLPPGMARGCTSAFGNAIVPQVAAEILKAWMECAP